MKRAALILLLLLAPGATRAQAPLQVPAPDLFLSANGGNNPVFTGWPLVVHLTIMNSSRASATVPPAALAVSPASGFWTDSVSFSIVSNTTGQAVVWPLKLVGTPSDPALTLAPTSYVRADWQLSASDVSSLPPDDYTVTATLQVAGPSGWNGTVQSPPLDITIAPEPGTLTSDQQFQKAMIQTEFALNVGDVDTAINVTQQVRVAQADNPLAASAAANVLEKAGYPTLAFMEANEALDTFYRVNPTAAEAPSNLLTMYQRLLGAVSTPEAVAQTVTSVSGATITFSPADQTIPLSALITTTGATVDGGTVTFTLGDFGTITSGIVTAGNSAATFTVPGGTRAGSYAIQGAYSGTSAFAASTSNVNGTLTIRQATPSLTWVNPADITQGTALGDAQLNAKASVPGEFAYVPTAGILLSAGNGQTLSVTFLPSDDIDYNSASASVVINVKDAALVPLTIAPESVSRPYGQPNPPFTANYNGFINGDTLPSLNGFLNCGTTAVPSSSVGSYAISCSGLSSQKYSITFVPGSLTVTAAPLTVSASGATRQFGQANPSFTAAFGGFVNGDTLASLAGTLACSSSATPSSPVSGNPYEITCSGVSSPNYSISFVPGSLTITKATPLITWTQPADITQGTALGSTQLSAAANVPGTFTYVPPAGTVLSVGTGQTLSATFVAIDTVDYISAAASVTINVNPKTQVRGDLNGDGVVDCADLNIVKASFGKKTGQAGFDARGDLNGDGIVNVIDLSAEAKLVPAGTTCK